MCSMISVGWVGSVGGEAWWQRRQIGGLGETTTRDQDLFGFVLDFFRLGGRKRVWANARDQKGLGFDPCSG